MHAWPSHYPAQCPPANAQPVERTIYRFINNRNIIEKDFTSYFKLKPEEDWGKNSCIARGLSIYFSLQACDELANAVPAMKKKKIASANITADMGLIGPTPSKNTKHHKTWWLPETAQNPASLFNIIQIEAT
jgi:hypothetical protein